MTVFQNMIVICHSSTFNSLNPPLAPLAGITARDIITNQPKVEPTLQAVPKMWTISLSQTYKNKILSRVSLSRVYKNKILGRVSLTRTYKNKILSRVSLSRVYKNKILARVSLSQTYINKIFVSTPTAPTIQTGSITIRKRSAWRQYIRKLGQDLRLLFIPKKKLEQPKEPEEVEIPPAQPPKTTIILPGPPTAKTKLETLNDKWSIVASVPPPEARTEIIYPVIINPLTSPLIQQTVTFPPRIAMKQPVIPFYRVADGAHIESQVIGFKKPKNRSKTASTINTLMILLEIESKL